MNNEAKSTSSAASALCDELNALFSAANHENPIAAEYIRQILGDAVAIENKIKTIVQLSGESE